MEDFSWRNHPRQKHATKMGVKLPALNSIVLSGFEGAASVRGARPPRTRPVPVPVSFPEEKSKK